MTTSMRVGIVGAGIGGVALARALHQRGIEAHLFERAAAFGEIGAGVQMTPNAAKVLKALGVGEGLARIGFLPNAMVGRNWDDARELFRTPLREVCPRLFGADFWHVHRADLHAILCEGLPAERVRFNVSCTGVTQRGDRAVAHFNDGTEFEADLIVGADGIHSVVRDATWGRSDARFTGHMCWRALVPVAQHPLPFVSPDASFWMGPKAHPTWVAESWTEPSTREELLGAYEGWHENIVKLFERTDKQQIFKWGLFDRDPMDRWSKGRVTLLGDAAHPMLPFLSQGAAMAIEDAYVLAAALSHFGADTNAALDAYEAERRPRTARVQLEARERGRTYHLASPEEQKQRDLAFQQAQAQNPNAVGIKAEWVYEYDATRCAERFGTTPAPALT